MNAKKICSEEVPQEFLKWLLSMGCPAEVVPSVEKMLLYVRKFLSLCTIFILVNNLYF